jgi:hypothetical protein
LWVLRYKGVDNIVVLQIIDAFDPAETDRTPEPIRLV